MCARVRACRSKAVTAVRRWYDQPVIDFRLLARLLAMRVVHTCRPDLLEIETCVGGEEPPMRISSLSPKSADSSSAPRIVTSSFVRQHSSHLSSWLQRQQFIQQHQVLHQVALTLSYHAGSCIHVLNHQSSYLKPNCKCKSNPNLVPKLPLPSQSHHHLRGYIQFYCININIIKSF